MILSVASRKYFSTIQMLSECSFEKKIYCSTLAAECLNDSNCKMKVIGKDSARLEIKQFIDQIFFPNLLKTVLLSITFTKLNLSIRNWFIVCLFIDWQWMNFIRLEAELLMKCSYLCQIIIFAYSESFEYRYWTLKIDQDPSQ